MLRTSQKKKACLKNCFSTLIKLKEIKYSLALSCWTFSVKLFTCPADGYDQYYCSKAHLVKLQYVSTVLCPSVSRRLNKDGDFA